MPAVAPILLSAMKVVAFDSNVVGEASLTAYVMPDSSLLLQGKPFFMPAFAESFEATFQLAFRIDRIGKTIAPRFAPRYIGAVAPAMAIKAVGMEPERLNGAFDGNVALYIFNGRAVEYFLQNDLGSAPCSERMQYFAAKVAEGKRFFRLSIGQEIKQTIAIRADELDIETAVIENRRHIGGHQSDVCFAAGNGGFYAVRSLNDFIRDLYAVDLFGIVFHQI